MTLPTFTPMQRTLAVCAAAAVAVFLWMQIDENGAVAGSPWLGSILIIVVLLGIAVSPRSIGTASAMGLATPVTAPNHPIGDEGSEAVRDRYQKLFAYLQAFFRGSIPDAPAGLVKLAGEVLFDQADRAAIRSAYAVYRLAIAHRSPDALRGSDAAALREVAIDQLTGLLDRESARCGNSDRPREHEFNRQFASKEIVALDDVYPKLVEAFRRKDRFPLDVLYSRIDEDLGRPNQTPAAREDFYGIKMRQALGIAGMRTKVDF